MPFLHHFRIFLSCTVFLGCIRRLSTFLLVTIQNENVFAFMFKWSPLPIHNENYFLVTKDIGDQTFHYLCKINNLKFMYPSDVKGYGLLLPLTRSKFGSKINFHMLYTRSKFSIKKNPRFNWS